VGDEVRERRKQKRERERERERELINKIGGQDYFIEG